MNRVLVLGAGGAVGKWVTRCLTKSPALEVYGHDDSEWNRRMVEVPHGDPESSYSLRYPVASPLITLWAGMPDTLVPSPEVVRKCDDKALCASLLGDLAPKTYWVRDTTGAGGKGAQMASEYLPGKNYAVEMVWHRGEMKAYFQKERISYDAKRTSDIVTGTAAVATCIDDPHLLELATEALRRVHPAEYHDDGEAGWFAPRPIHGIFTVDFKCNEAGEPKVTEINAGKFATSSYPFYHLSWNLPLLAVELALGMEPTPLERYPLGLTVIRGYDTWPFIGRV